MILSRVTYRLNISETISTSVSAAAIFSAEEGCGRPPPNKLNDMAAVSVTSKNLDADVEVTISKGYGKDI